MRGGRRWAPGGNPDDSCRPQLAARASTPLTSYSYLMAPRPSAEATSAKCGVSLRGWCCPSPGQRGLRVYASPPCSTATTHGQWTPTTAPTRTPPPVRSRELHVPGSGFREPRGSPPSTRQGILLRSRDLPGGALTPETPLPTSVLPKSGAVFSDLEMESLGGGHQGLEKAWVCWTPHVLAC